MKRLINSTLAVMLFLAVICLAACTSENKNIWEDAVYTEDTELGSGGKTVTLEVTAIDKTVTFTIHTDKATLGAALLEHGIISGKDGLYTKVNGMTADYNVDQSYWAFYINGDYAMEGMDTTEISEGGVYKLEYTK